MYCTRYIKKILFSIYFIFYIFLLFSISLAAYYGLDKFYSSSTPAGTIVNKYEHVSSGSSSRKPTRSPTRSPSASPTAIFEIDFPGVSRRLEDIEYTSADFRFDNRTGNLHFR